MLIQKTVFFILFSVAIQRLIDNGILTSRTDDPYYVDVVQP